MLDNGDHPAVVLKSPHVADAPTVAVYGHYDVQPSGDVREPDEANHGTNENLDRHRFLTAAHTSAAILANLAAHSGRG